MPVDDLSREDPRVSGLFDQVKVELRLLVIKDRTFQGEDVYLDGRSFIRCVFVECQLVSRLGLFNLQGCRIQRPRGVIISGPSLRLYELMKDNLDAGGELIVGLDEAPEARA